MAKWPIVRSQRTLPIPSLERGTLDFDTGEAEVWENIGRITGVASQTLIGIHLKQADNQFMNASLDAKVKWDELADELSTNLDENTFMAAYEKKLEEIKGLRPKNETAGRMFDASIKNQAIDQKKATREAMKLRVNDTWQVTKDRLTEDAIRTGSIALLSGHMLAGTEAGLTKRSVAMNHLRDTRNKMEYQAGLNWSLTNPESLLKNIKEKDGQIQVEGFVTLTKGQVIALRANAQGTIDFRKRQKSLAQAKRTELVAKEAIDPKSSPESIAALINEMDATDTEKRDLLNKYNIAGSIPYKTTENWPLYNEHRKRAANKNITEKEIMDNVGPGGYSWPEAEGLIRVINGKSSSAKAFEDSDAAENLGKLIDDIVDDVPLNQFATQKGMGLLEDAIRNNPDWTNREKKEEALRIGRRIESEYQDGTLETGLEDVMKRTAITRSPGFFAKKGLAPSGFKAKGIPSPKTKAEYDALPSGTVYIHPEKGRVTKQ